IELTLSPITKEALKQSGFFQPFIVYSDRFLAEARDPLIKEEENGNLYAACSINLPYQSGKEQIYFSLYNQKDQEVKKEEEEEDEEGAVLGSYSKIFKSLLPKMSFHYTMQGKKTVTGLGKSAGKQLHCTNTGSLKGNYTGKWLLGNIAVTKDWYTNKGNRRNYCRSPRKRTMHKCHQGIKIENTTLDNKDETVDRIITEYSQIAEIDYQKKHDRVGKTLHWHCYMPIDMKPQIKTLKIITKITKIQSDEHLEHNTPDPTIIENNHI
ncbi:hypothetical protein L345_00076, partial [Ophiophagus hannah]